MPISELCPSKLLASYKLTFLAALSQRWISQPGEHVSLGWHCSIPVHSSTTRCMETDPRLSSEMHSCFFNCIIQCLSSTVPLLNAINSPPMSSPSLVALAPSTTDHEPPFSPLPITKAFLSLMERLSALPAGDASSQRRAKIVSFFGSRLMPLTVPGINAILTPTVQSENVIKGVEHEARRVRRYNPAGRS